MSIWQRNKMKINMNMTAINMKMANTKMKCTENVTMTTIIYIMTR